MYDSYKKKTKVKDIHTQKSCVTHHEVVRIFSKSCLRKSSAVVRSRIWIFHLPRLLVKIKSSNLSKQYRNYAAC